MRREIDSLRHRLILLCLVYSGLLPACQTLHREPQLKDFVSDGCTLVPEQIPKVLDLSEDHCYIHDFRYWKGGTRQQRLEADRQLRDSVKASGKPLLAEATFLTVRLTGGPWVPMPWRWGFGWTNYPRAYRELTPAEREKVKTTTASPNEELDLEQLRLNARIRKKPGKRQSP